MTNDLLFVESIKVRDGIFCNLPLHEERMQRTAGHFFSTKPTLILTEEDIPAEFRRGMVKCRVIYSKDIHAIEYLQYTFRNFRKMKLIEDNEIDYTYKTVNKARFHFLLGQKEEADEILIIKNGYVTDASSSNVVFENEEGLFTPSTCLLKGTKRELLLEKKVIREKEIKPADISSYSKIYLINAMIDLEDNICIHTNDIIY